MFDYPGVLDDNWKMNLDVFILTCYKVPIFDVGVIRGTKESE